MDELFDLTLGYTGIEGTEIPYYSYLVDKVFFSGQYPRQIHIHVEKRSLKSIPGLRDEDHALDQVKQQHHSSQGNIILPLKDIEASRKSMDIWLRERFMEKDERLAGFFKSGQFSAIEYNTPSGSKELSHEAKTAGNRTIVPLTPSLVDWMSVGLVYYFGFKFLPVYWSFMVWMIRLFL